MKILIVEDDAMLGRLWLLAFQKAGHDAVHVKSASAARKSLMVRPADMIILDLNLGSEGGLTLATLAGYVNPQCRVIVVTGTQLFPHGELFSMDRSIAAVMRKPVDLREMLAMVEHHGAEPAFGLERA
jgi:DNA-binding NtrC family response regulator